VLARIAWFAPLCSVDFGEVLGLCEALLWVSELGTDIIDLSMDQSSSLKLSTVIIVATLMSEALLVIVKNYLIPILPTLR
jgi:hypothetical protein